MDCSASAHLLQSAFSSEKLLRSQQHLMPPFAMNKLLLNSITPCLATCIGSRLPSLAHVLPGLISFPRVCSISRVIPQTF